MRFKLGGSGEQPRSYSDRVPTIFISSSKTNKQDISRQKVGRCYRRGAATGESLLQVRHCRSRLLNDMISRCDIKWTFTILATCSDIFCTEVSQSWSPVLQYKINTQLIIKSIQRNLLAKVSSGHQAAAQRTGRCVTKRAYDL